MALQLISATALILFLTAGCLAGEQALPPDQALAKAAARGDSILKDVNATPDTAAPPVPAETPAKPNDVSFWYFEHPIYSSLLSRPETLAAFRDAHPGVTLSSQFIGEWNIAVQKFTVTVAAGDLPDVALVKRPWFERLVRSGRIAALDTVLPPALVDDLRKPSRDALTVNGRLYAMPADGFCSVLYFNRDLVGETAPRTWDELKTAAAKLSNQGPSTGKDRIIPIGDLPFLETLWSANGELVKGARSGMSDPEAREALDFLLGLRTAGLADPGVLGNTERAFNLFEAGRVAMTVASSEHLSRAQKCGLKVGVAPVPGKTGPLSLLSENVIVVFNRYAAAKRSSLAGVLDFLTGPTLQGATAAERGSAPVRTSAMPPTFLPGLDQAYQLGRATPLSPRWNEIQFETMRYVQLAYLWNPVKR
ncbi:MAG: extracellular solute-binding protein [Candidatus Hydrogenedentes bacterium]|nr:extracellular solute-binding protein [Candidatus Hydrogenedentota bacterium]